MTAAEFKATFGKKKGRTGQRLRTEAPEVAKMEAWLKYSGIEYVKEYKFHPKRKWRADIAIPSKMVLIEWDGIMSEKSRHTSVTGFSEDCNKMNAAQLLGWKVLRYTVINKSQFFTDIELLINQ
jgi:very-short-patch-repair endonuclease